MDMMEARVKINDKIRATDLLNTFEYYADQIKVLSLDCFDTLLWRKTAAPTDVFYDLQNKPMFKSLGFTAFMRMRSEANARTVKFFQKMTNEVQLKEIYRNFSPTLTEEELNTLQEEELAAEVE